MTICISTGNCSDLNLFGLDAINYLLKKQIDGIELLFPSSDKILKFELDTGTQERLIGAKHNSIHMPWKDLQYKKNDSLTEKVLAKGLKIAEQVNAKYLVFHPSAIKDFSLLDFKNFQSAIENLNEKEASKGFQKFAEIEKVLSKHSFLKLFFDLHQAFANKDNLSQYMKILDEIIAIHVNSVWIRKSDNKVKKHGFLTEADKKQFKQYAPFLKTNKPKIIEADFYPNKVKLIDKEIELLRRFGN